MNRFLSYSLLFVLAASCNAVSPAQVCDNDKQVLEELFWGKATPVETLNPHELRSRYATVKVFTPGSGRGTGTYVSYKDQYLVVTAAHVVDASHHSYVWVVTPEKERTKGWIVYFDNEEDVCILAVKKMESILAVPFRTNTSPLPEIGETLTYSGYPGHHDLLTLRGDVAGIEKISGGRTKITVHTYGWPGASGSGFFDKKGNFVGVLVAIPVGRGYVPQLLESMVYATPISVLSIDRLEANLCAEQNWIHPAWCPTDK